MSELKLREVFQLKNINLRPENHGDEKVLAVDLKVMGWVNADKIVPLFGLMKDEFDIESFKKPIIIFPSWKITTGISIKIFY